MCSLGSNWQYDSLGLDNGFVPTRRQAIIWTNDGIFTDAYMRHSAYELNADLANLPQKNNNPLPGDKGLQAVWISKYRPLFN